MTASPNFDPNINLRKEIDHLMRDLDLDEDSKKKLQLDIHERVGKILKDIQKLDNRLNNESNQLIQDLKAKLKAINRHSEANRLDSKVQTIAQPVTFNNISKFPREIQREFFSFLSPKELLANRTLSISRKLREVAIEVVINKINKDRVPLRDLGLNRNELRYFIQKFGNKIEFLNFDHIFRSFDRPEIIEQENFFQHFSFKEIGKCCPNLKGLSLVSCAITTDQIKEISDINLLNFRTLIIYDDPNFGHEEISPSLFRAPPIDNNKIDSKAILLLAEGSFRNLEQLDISIGGVFGNNKCRTLQEQDDLYGTILTDLATILGSLNQLKKLRIRELKSGWEGVDQKNFENFCTALRNMVQLEQLNLRDFYSDSDYMSKVLFDAIRSLVNLKYLNLCNYKIKNSELINKVTNMLEGLKSLEFIDFSKTMPFLNTSTNTVFGNNLTAHDIATFINALGALPLKECILHSNEFNDSVIVAAFKKLFLNLPESMEPKFFELADSLDKHSLLQLANLLQSPQDHPNFKRLTLDIGCAFTDGGSQITDINGLIKFGKAFQDAECIFVSSKRSEELRKVNIGIYGANRDGSPKKQLFLSLGDHWDKIKRYFFN